MRTSIILTYCGMSLTVLFLVIFIPLYGFKTVGLGKQAFLVDGFTNKVSRDKVTQQPEVYRMGLQYMGPFGSTILFNSSYQQFYIKDQVCYNKLSAKYVTLDLLVAFRTLDTSSFRMHYGPDFDFQPVFGSIACEVVDQFNLTELVPQLYKKLEDGIGDRIGKRLPYFKTNIVKSILICQFSVADKIA